MRQVPVPLEEAPQPTLDDVTEETPTPEQKAIIRKIHVNLGQRSEECQQNKKPALKRPSMLPRAYTFNRVIGIDCVELKVGSLTGEHYLNVICWGTRLQAV
eukprot:2405051-Amphidinium_carterae.1